MPFDGVASDDVCSNVSHLNMYAHVFRSMSGFNDSVSLCFSPERGLVPSG